MKDGGWSRTGIPFPGCLVTGESLALNVLGLELLSGLTGVEGILFGRLLECVFCVVPDHEKGRQRRCVVSWKTKERRRRKTRDKMWSNNRRMR